MSARRPTVDEHNGDEAPRPSGSAETPTHKRSARRRERLVEGERGIIFSLRAIVVFIVFFGAALTYAAYIDGNNTRAASGEQYESYQLTRDGSDTLQALIAANALANGTLYYNTSTEGTPGWHGANDSNPDGMYVTLPDEHPYKNTTVDGASVDILNQTLGDDRYRYNIVVKWRTEDGDEESQPLVYQGAPDNGAVTVNAIRILEDDDVLLNEDGQPITNSSGDPCRLVDVNASGDRCESVPGEEEFYAPDVFTNSVRFNIVRVEVTVWRV